MKNTSRKILLSLSLCFALGAHSQGQDTSEADASLFSYAPTPQTQAFIRYGSNPVELYTGNLSVSILYTHTATTIFKYLFQWVIRHKVSFPASRQVFLA